MLISWEYMPENLPPCITTRFSVGALHVFNMERKVLYNDMRCFGGLLLRALDSELETSDVEGSELIKSLEWRI